MKKNRVIIMLTTLSVSAAVILFGLFSFQAAERKISADETFFILFVPGRETPMALEVERGIR